MDEGADERYPALRARGSDAVTQAVDQARRVLWRAFQRGELSEEEFARTLQRLEPAPGGSIGGEFAEDVLN